MSELTQKYLGKMLHYNPDTEFEKVENVRLREGLGYYANKDNWSCATYEDGWDFWYLPDQATEKDVGQKARDILSKDKEQESGDGQK